MALEAAIFSIILAFIRRGRFSGLMDMFDRIRHLWLIFVPAGLLAISVIGRNYRIPQEVWGPVTGGLHFVANIGFLVLFCVNRRLPGMKWLLVGQVMNLVPVMMNGGKMPVAAWAAKMAGTPDPSGETMRHAGMAGFHILGDYIPLTSPPMLTAAVVSPGDVLMAVGIFWLIQAAMCQRKRSGVADVSGKLPVSSRKPFGEWLKAAYVVAIITAIATAFRLIGIRWGLPNQLHDFTYHPDEVFQVGAMLRVAFITGLDPEFYSYPSGYINLGAVAMKLAVGHGMSLESMVGPYMVARIVVVLLGILTVPIIYSAGTRLYGKVCGILAAAIFAVMPLHIVHSHFATVDVPAAFWVAATMLAAAVVVEKPTLKTYLAAGIFAGFAVGTKYNVALVMFPVIAAHFAREDEKSVIKRICESKLWLAVIGFLLGFILSTPGVLVWPGKYWGGFIFEMKHAATGHGLVFAGRVPGWFDVLTSGLGYGLGVLLLVFAVIAVGFALVRHNRSDWIILSFLLPYFVVISFSEVRFARYVIPMLPAVAILTARMMVSVHNVLREQRIRAMQGAWIVICACVVGYTSIYAAAFDRLFVQPDPREQALTWFNSRVDSGDTIGLLTVPWYYSPPFTRGIIGVVGRENRHNLMSESDFSLVTAPGVEWDWMLIERENPQYIIVSDYEIEDPMRVGLTEARKWSKDLRACYTDLVTFEKRFSALGIDFGPTSRLPHDLKYMAPTLSIYGRK